MKDKFASKQREELSATHTEQNLDLSKISAEITKKYALESVLGQGAQGRVYKARRLSDQKPVAIKQLSIDSIKTWKTYDLFSAKRKYYLSYKLKALQSFTRR
ncbi:MAG: hypothetical protein WC966_02110 [Bradymonadales bacterium]